MEAKAFENVKNQISYCAIWCGSCVIGNGVLKELTKRYAHLIGAYGVDEWGAEDQGFDGQEFVKTLQLVQAIPTCPGCHKGGGITDCKIRACASSRRLADCTECKDFMTCENREPLHKVRTGALKAGMLIKTAKDQTGQRELTEKWTAEIRNRFPNCLVFSDECTSQ